VERILKQSRPFFCPVFAHDMVAVLRWIDHKQEAELVRLLLAAVNH